jgi:hypothetical protein
MILRYDPKVSLTLVSESLSAPEVSNEVIPWMVVTFPSAVWVPVQYFSMILRHFLAICDGSVCRAPVWIGDPTSASGIGK